MFYAQTRTTNDPIVLTKIALKNPAVVNGYTYNSKVPDELQGDYNRAIFEHGLFYQDLSDLFHQTYPNPPYSMEHFTDMLKSHFGFSTTIICFTNLQNTDLKGRWKWDDESMRNFTIWVNNNLPDTVRKTTVIHECLHAVQDVDPKFLTMLGAQHVLLRRPLADRIAQKCAVEMVLPRAEYERCMRKGMTSAQIADSYAVSMALVRNYRS